MKVAFNKVFSGREIVSKMADLEAVLADVSYLMAMEKSKCTPAARASKKIILPDPRWVPFACMGGPAAARRASAARASDGPSNGRRPSQRPEVGCLESVTRCEGRSRFVYFPWPSVGRPPPALGGAVLAPGLGPWRSLLCFVFASACG